MLLTKQRKAEGENDLEATIRRSIHGFTRHPSRNVKYAIGYTGDRNGGGSVYKGLGPLRLGEAIKRVSTDRKEV